MSTSSSYPGTGRDRRTPAGPAGVPSTPDQTRGVPSDADRPTVTVAEFDDYATAQRAVDYLSDNRFPVDRVAIVGTSLRLVEKVLGRLTVGRAALAGAGTGAWFGLLIGVLLGIFAVSAWWRVILVTLVAGIAWGAAFGAVAHAMTRGRRDFTSLSRLQADRYAIVVDAEYAEQARELLGRMR